MSTNMQANAELELRSLDAHELDIVSGAGIPVQQEAVIWGWGSWGPYVGGGPFKADALTYSGLGYDAYSASKGPAHLSLPA